MTKTDRKEALARVQEIAHNARTLCAYDGHSSPPDWRPFVAELADEVAKILAPPVNRSRRAASFSTEDKKTVATVMTRLRRALRDACGKLRVNDAQTLAGFTHKSHYGTTIVGRAMHQLGWDRRRCRLDGELKYAYTKGTRLQRENLLKLNARGTILTTHIKQKKRP